jgi:hypothetical protein
VYCPSRGEESLHQRIGIVHAGVAFTPPHENSPQRRFRGNSTRPVAVAPGARLAGCPAWPTVLAHAEVRRRKVWSSTGRSGHALQERVEYG